MPLMPSRGARLGRRIARGAATVVGVVALTMVTAIHAPAQVGDTGDYTANGVRIRSGPATDYTTLGLGYPGQDACLFYYRQDENGTPMLLWWNHVNIVTGVRGYSSDALVRVRYPRSSCGLVLSENRNHVSTGR